MCEHEQMLGKVVRKLNAGLLLIRVVCTDCDTQFQGVMAVWNGTEPEKEEAE